MLLKASHLLLQSEKDTFVQERNTAERQVTVGTLAVHIKDKTVSISDILSSYTSKIKNTASV